ncbi:hypothetical protein ASPSYDRAFT_156330 [Aspergillus sydowii CBS 593.65]|uniref:Uncharacterized protein n=1 Tax=Aspergillus sydowii CBS 593.65 TaxID=1036612 RepID=A0A1L9TAI3_9EURO|nr:uncharacterized protein ASPSYDRAFT_156330 [Aspergillus sydowii CBS 593.65]OJJ56439.1 hypothetical protein ASPSYDRAFT_156330 [Aspergillus sydowii CBS 593.65]
MGGLGGAGPGADESDAGIIDAGIANHGLANTGFTNPGIADSAHNVHNVPGFPGLSAPEATPGGSILTVGGTSNEGASEAAKLSYKMWVCIMNNDLRGVTALLREGANPMMNLKYGGYALDMAIRMKDKKEVVQAVLKMGMGGRLMNDETLKLIFHGFACRHGTLEMLDFLDINGTWFSWKSYGRWCISLTHKTEAWANAAKIRELRARYMLREEQKEPLIKMNDMLDPLPEDQALKPIEEIVRLYCEKYPNVIIQDYFEDGYLSPRNQNQRPAVGHAQTWVQYLHDRNN